MNNVLIIGVSYGIYLTTVALFVAGAWYSEKLDPDNDLPPTIWDEILPPPAPARMTHPMELSLPPALSGKKG